MKVKYWIPTIVILIFIWGNSALNGSISESISSFIQYVLTGQDIDMIILTGSGHLLRKIAHFSEYLALSMALAYGYHHDHHGKTILHLWSLFLLVAPLDEFIQRFSDGRNASINDVILDWSGYIIGCIIALLILNRIKHHKTDH